MGLTPDPHAKWIKGLIVPDCQTQLVWTLSLFSVSSYIIFSIVLAPRRLATAPQSRLHKNVQQAQFIYDPHLLVNKLVCLLCATHHKHIFHCLSPLPLSWHYYITTTPSHLFSFTNIISALDVLHAWDDLRSSSSRAGFHATDYRRMLSRFSPRLKKNNFEQMSHREDDAFAERAMIVAFLYIIGRRFSLCKWEPYIGALKHGHDWINSSFKCLWITLETLKPIYLKVRFKNGVGGRGAWQKQLWFPYSNRF